MFNADYPYCFLHFQLVLLNSGHGAAMAEWCGGYFAYHHSQFVKGGPP